MLPDFRTLKNEGVDEDFLRQMQHHKRQEQELLQKIQDQQNNRGFSVSPASSFPSPIQNMAPTNTFVSSPQANTFNPITPPIGSVDYSYTSQFYQNQLQPIKRQKSFENDVGLVNSHIKKN